MPSLASLSFALEGATGVPPVEVLESKSLASSPSSNSKSLSSSHNRSRLTAATSKSLSVNLRYMASTSKSLYSWSRSLIKLRSILSSTCTKGSRSLSSSSSSANGLVRVNGNGNTLSGNTVNSANGFSFLLWLSSAATWLYRSLLEAACAHALKKGFSFASTSRGCPNSLCNNSFVRGQRSSSCPFPILARSTLHPELSLPWSRKQRMKPTSGAPGFLPFPVTKSV